MRTGCCHAYSYSCSSPPSPFSRQWQLLCASKDDPRKTILSCVEVEAFIHNDIAPFDGRLLKLVAPTIVLAVDLLISRSRVLRSLHCHGQFAWTEGSGMGNEKSSSYSDLVVYPVNLFVIKKNREDSSLLGHRMRKHEQCVMVKGQGTLTTAPGSKLQRHHSQKFIILGQDVTSPSSMSDTIPG